MATEREIADSTSDADDKLTDITGLGAAAERDLHSIGIRSVDDLIPYTPEELARRLTEQTKKQRYSDKFIANKDWIGQAKRIVDERNKLRASSPLGGAAAAPDAQAARSRVEGWSRHAEFTLYFENRTSEQGDQTWQTRIWHTCIRDRECDKEETFDGVTPEPWVKWIFQQADLSGEIGLELTEQAPAAPPAPATPGPAQVAIPGVGVELRSLPDARSKTLVASARFMISGANAETLTLESTPYQILVLTVDHERRLPKLVAAEHGLLQPGQLAYAHQLEFPLPDLGRYELQTIVSVRAPDELMAIHHGPNVTITP